MPFHSHMQGTPHAHSLMWVRRVSSRDSRAESYSVTRLPKNLDIFEGNCKIMPGRISTTCMSYIMISSVRLMLYDHLPSAPYAGRWPHYHTLLSQLVWLLLSPVHFTEGEPGSASHR